VPGSDLDGIHQLRTIEDSNQLRYALGTASRIVVVGAGWIGSEVAASARGLGVDVVLLDPRSNPLEKVLGSEVAPVFRQLHERHGVEFHPNARVHSFVGDDHVEAVRTTAGVVIPADLVLMGIGVRPRSELARAAGLRLQDGVVVDEMLQTSAPRIFAAGDVASAWHPLFQRRIRVEHWANAKEQGPVAARNLLGKAVPFDRIPWFLSDQYDFQIDYTGYATQWDDVVFRGDPASGKFVTFWILEGLVEAGMSTNVPGMHEPIEALVRSRRRVEIDALQDEDVPLEMVGERQSDDAIAATVR
jgi:3-phenylpropionate/trans-cinnamate dioxygenase ferredoxin reductase subunit